MELHASDQTRFRSTWLFIIIVGKRPVIAILSIRGGGKVIKLRKLGRMTIGELVKLQSAIFPGIQQDTFLPDSHPALSPYGVIVPQGLYNPPCTNSLLPPSFLPQKPLVLHTYYIIINFATS
ncbi:MAG: hypothetical protein WD491_12830 [Balneolales bacterium]